MGVEAGRLVAGLAEVLEGLVPALAAQEVAAEDALELAEPAGVELLHRLADAGMELAALRREEALVGDLLGQRVLEDVLELRGAAELPDELLPLEVGEVGLEALGIGQSLEDAVGEDPPDDRGLLGRPVASRRAAGRAGPSGRPGACRGR